MPDPDEFRVEFTITRRRGGEVDFTEIGFGSSGAWSDINTCSHAVDSILQNQDWETETGQPDPKEFRR